MRLNSVCLLNKLLDNNQTLTQNSIWEYEYYYAIYLNNILLSWNILEIVFKWTGILWATITGKVLVSIKTALTSPLFFFLYLFIFTSLHLFILTNDNNSLILIFWLFLFVSFVVWLVLVISVHSNSCWLLMCIINITCLCPKRKRYYLSRYLFYIS